jgi:hypothetical protein
MPPAEIIKLLIVGARRRIVVSPNATKLTWDNFYRQVGKPETAGLGCEHADFSLVVPASPVESMAAGVQDYFAVLISPSVTPY